MVCDFHSHALFGIDDGAKDIEMSTEMLRKSKSMGVDTVILTSHCYPRSEEDIEKYLNRYDERYEALSSVDDIPRLIRACEVNITRDLSRFSNIKKLCIENTDYMLLEMPHTPWTDKTVEVVYKLILMGIKPIIAHDERNMEQKPEHRYALYDLDVLIQINAPSLFMHMYKKEIDRMMKLGLVHVLGTDMHNLKTRKPCFDVAEKRIKKRYGSECWEYMMQNAEKILNNETIPYRGFKSFRKKNIL